MPAKNPKDAFRSKLVPRIRFNLSYFPIDCRNADFDALPRLPAILEIKLLKASNLLAVNADGSNFYAFSFN